LLGLSTEVKEYRFAELATLRPVEEPPGEVELARALKDKTLLSAVGRYSHSITHELAVKGSLSPENQGAFNLAWWIVAAVRIKTLAEILVPAVSDHTWSTIAAVPQDSCNIQLIEDVPRARRLGPPVSVKELDLRWVDDHLESFAALLELEVQKFRLAVDSLTTHQQEASLRMTTASLWVGLEALFGVKAELCFRLAALVASCLEARGEQRITLYHDLKHLYDFRSKAVHGEKLTDEVLIAHILQVRRLLSRVLCKMVEEKRVPSEDDLDVALLG
jgi:hypothetical protein